MNAFELMKHHLRIHKLFYFKKKVYEINVLIEDYLSLTNARWEAVYSSKFQQYILKV